MDSVWWLFLVCAVVLCTVMAGATDAPLEQGRINQLSVCLSVCGLANAPLTMTFSAFLVVIDIHRVCCSEFAVTVIMPAIYIDLASH